MKQIILIEHNSGQLVFKGKLINLPMKAEAIKIKCIELFNDDDPCIIHQSYAIAKFAEDILNAFQRTTQIKTPLEPYLDELNFIDLPDLRQCLVTIEVKK